MDRSLGIWEWHYDKERGRGMVRVYQRVSKQCVRYLCGGCMCAVVCLRVPNKCAVNVDPFNSSHTSQHMFGFPTSPSSLNGLQVFLDMHIFRCRRGYGYQR